ncbi:MAG: DUF418 domain-containing protein [Phycisphaeraceae bacterium]|nr:MAG: DUF418 domain-containing protein [Phycisphaeraceae bacterium]
MITEPHVTPPPIPPTPIPPAPVADRQRVTAVDEVRGLAVLGILPMNIVTFALPFAAYMAFTNPAVNAMAGEFTGLNRRVWWINHLIFDQKMMTLFSLLFGAGISMMHRRVSESRGLAHAPWAGVFYRRMLALLAIGLAHAYLIWFGDILVTYALCGMLLYPLRKFSARTLAIVGVALLAVMTLLNIGMGMGLASFRDEALRVQALLDSGETLTKAQQETLDGWRETSSMMSPDAAKIAEETAARRGGFIDNARQNFNTAIFFQTAMFLMWGLWRVTGLMLLGMALERAGFFAARMSPRVYAAFAAVGYVVAVPLVAVGGVRLLENDGDMVDFYLISGHFNGLGSILVSLAHASVLMLLVRAGRAAWARGRLAAVGRMAFSNYLAQSLICTFIFYGWGLGYFGEFERGPVYLVVLGVWALQLAWSPWWLDRFAYGPAEWLWRWMTYGRRPPMRRPHTTLAAD